jgi:hypothetical protein
LRRANLHGLMEACPLEQLLARQAEAFAIDEQNEKRFGKTCESLPDDIINFLHDPLACAIALGYTDGIEIEGVPLCLEERDGFLHEQINPKGKIVRIVTGIDGPRFNQFWLDKIMQR